ncbi:unnamed protein product [Clonostachys chloroleuca]|uniref:Wax synthase domain-containing protein n=1 Tax=Clonostachys chloroleuca TaxID=1926264 RepID=A0AA35MED4_9HYPO|nr:unnamed protein product [Clonostachys chloroleuca]
MHVLLPSNISAVPIEHLGDVVRAQYRAAFTQAVAQGQARVLVVPYTLLGPLIIPAVWLAIPHSESRWMKLATWLVVGLAVFFDLDILRGTSSTNLAAAYAAGLLANWGIMSTLALLVFRKPQLYAARAVRRSNNAPSAPAANASFQNGHSSAVNDDSSPSQRENGVHHRKPHREGSNQISPNGQSPATKHEGEYAWEPFPAHASFGKRLGWSLDAITNFRFTGWNWSISALPRPKLDHGSITGESLPTTPFDLDSIPIVTEAGYRRCLSHSEFVWDRVKTVGIMYLVLDFLAVFMMKDPYFVLGPDQAANYPLPPHLARLSPWILYLYREVFCLLGVLTAISGIFNLNDLVQYFLVSRLWPMRGELWMNPSTFGSFTNVLERGLAGWWGQYWHQLFRSQFAAPARWLVRKGFVSRDSIPGVLVALTTSFLQSGLFHAFGSVTCIPRTKLWRPTAFFLLQVVGIALQSCLSLASRRYLPPTSILRHRRVGQVSNVLFTFAWLCWTAVFLSDDFASTGIWLLEPVPISLFRAFGFGYPTDHWWRWDEHHWPRWYTAPNWWQSGIRI